MLLPSLTTEEDVQKIVDYLKTKATGASVDEAKAAGADIVKEYIDTATERMTLALQGRLRVRPMGKSIYEPPKNTAITQNPFN